MSKKTFNVFHLKVDGTRGVVEVSEANALAELQALVGGLIEPLSARMVNGVPEGTILVVNEEGRLLGLPPNPFAEGILGDAVLMRDADLK